MSAKYVISYSGIHGVVGWTSDYERESGSNPGLCGCLHLSKNVFDHQILDINVRLDVKHFSI